MNFHEKLGVYKLKESLFKKFLKFSYGSWVGLILGLGSTMIITRILPPDALGKASMFNLVLQVGMILTIFGTDQAFVRFFYEEEEFKRGALLYNTLKIPFLTTIVMLIVVLTFYKPITSFLVGYPNFPIAIWLALGIIGQLLHRYSQLVIRMQQKGNLYSILQMFLRIFNISFILIFFYLIGSNFEILIWSKVITFFLLVIIAIYFGKDFWNLKNFKVSDVKHTQLEIFKYGSPYVLTLFITWLFESFDKIALRQWSTFEELGQYSAAMRLVALVVVLRTSFSTFWSPIAYEKFENEPDDKEFFRSMSVLVSFVMFFVAIGSIAGKDIIVILLGKDYVYAATIMPFLVFMPVLYTISHTTVMGINFYKKTKFHIYIAIISCIVNITGNYILVPSYGALGASISTAISFVVFFTLRTQFSLKLFKVNYPLIKIYIMIGIVMIYSLYSVFNKNFWLNILIGIIAALILMLLYYKDLIYIMKNKRKIFNN